MINRDHLNRFQPLRRPKRGISAVGDILGLIAIIGAVAVTASLFQPIQKASYSPMFEKILSGDLKEGDSGQLSGYEKIWLSKIKPN